MPLKKQEGTITFQKQCKTCKRIKNDMRRKSGPYLIDRIYKSQQWVRGGEPLTKIWRDYGGENFCTYLAFRNHAMKHQMPSEDALLEAKMAKVTEKSREEQIQQIVSTDHVRREVIDAAMAALEAGDLKLTATHLLKAAKDQDDVEAKKRDQGMQVMKMIAAFQSGEIDASHGYLDGETVE